MAKRERNGKSLVIVESPAKAKTIGKYLGPKYTVKASMGHVRDLPSGELGVDLENGFAPTYVNVGKRAKLLAELSKAAARAETVFLATDMDREGEAIAWHVAVALDLPADRIQRVMFNEITKSAIQNAFAHPHKVDMDKVNAQQARRILDRIVGYQLSPLLWKKVAKGLSAGRVQSVTVRLVVEREWAIRAFVPTESWRISLVLTPDASAADQLAADWGRFLGAGQDLDEGRTQKERTAWLTRNECLQAELVKLDGKAFKTSAWKEAREVAIALGFECEEVDRKPWEQYAEHDLFTVDLNGSTNRSKAPSLTVKELQKKRTQSRPPAPFTTATLQQAASSQLGFSVSRTMRVAQQLYEGVELNTGDGPVGLITYMRTDSTNLSAEAVGHARKLIQRDFGERYLPAKPNVFGKTKRAQEAHEAVRASDVGRTPQAVKGHLTSEQGKLYGLIWRRFVACQMSPAQWDNTTVWIAADIDQGEALFKATGRRLVFDGFQRVAGTSTNGDLILPDLDEGAPLTPLSIEPVQQFTSPPARYSEASLVKALEADGIGRPSTYAAIIQTIQDRGYIEQQDRRLYATDLGQVVTEKLIEHFPKIMDVKFTSFMEDELDKIEEAHLDWVHVLQEFYTPFKEALDRSHVEMQTVRAEPSEYKCPQCESEMVYRWTKTGRFLSCTAYPDCKGAYNVDRDGKPIIPKDIDLKCEQCDSPMILRQSRHGPFLGCSSYPDCRNTIACDANGDPLRLVTEKELERPCEACGKGTLKVKRRGMRAFLGCDKFPKCKNTTPLPEDVRLERKVVPVEEAGFVCDRCGQAMHIKAGRRGKFIACSGFPRCRNTYPIEKLDELKAAVASGKLAQPVAKKSTGKNGEGTSRREVPRTPEGKIDYEAMGPPPPGFAWTRTGRPVVETWPEQPLSCPNCGNDLLLKSGRFGPFYSCTNFPQCRTSINLRGDAKKRAEKEMPGPERVEPIPTDIDCPECGQKMLIRVGRSGRFLGCGAYPKCKTTQPMPEELSAAASASSS